MPTIVGKQHRRFGQALGLIGALALCSLPIGASAEEVRAAKVVVTNNSGFKISNLRVFHKYSDEFSDELTGGDLAPGASTKPPAQCTLAFGEKPEKAGKIDQICARYYTGFWTTGRDWWIVVFDDDKGRTFVSSPVNFRRVIDGLEKNLLDVTPSLLKLIPDPSAGMGTGALDVVIRSVFNKAETYNEKFGVNFKQHILRPQDGNKVTTIEIATFDAEEEEGRLRFLSPSGSSRTKYKPLAKKDVDLMEKVTDDWLKKAKQALEDEIKRRETKPTPTKQ